jgi:hypothetical protein
MKRLSARERFSVEAQVFLDDGEGFEVRRVEN